MYNNVFSSKIVPFMR